MHEEVNDKTIAISVKATKMTAAVLKEALKKLIAQLDKQKNKAVANGYKGKQSLKKLLSQNTGVSNIEITDGNIKAFEGIAKKYGIDYALKKDSSEQPPKYLVFFKGRDVDVMTNAFKEFVSTEVKKREKPSIIQTLAALKEKIKAMSPPSKVRDKERDR